MKLIAYHQAVPLPDAPKEDQLRDWLVAQGYRDPRTYPVREGVELYRTQHPWHGYALYIPAEVTGEATLIFYIPTAPALQVLVTQFQEAGRTPRPRRGFPDPAPD